MEEKNCREKSGELENKYLSLFSILKSLFNLEFHKFLKEFFVQV
jgi:hypothetical protein